uniref:Uncharacterized protein n=1 Tax=viral metagenome TaxID=1070528 RepID=A0A6C0IAX0_9ZZZZ
MSYAPIYNKLRELEERLAVVEVSPPKSEVSSWNTITDASVSEVSGYDNLGVLSEIATLRTDLDNLSKECALNSSAVSLLSTGNSTKDAVDVSALAALATKEELDALAAKGEAFALATKDELAALATKDELATLATKDELATLATKDELATLATKGDVADLNTKFDNVINVLAQLNEKINDAHAKIAAIAAIAVSE